MAIDNFDIENSFSKPVIGIDEVGRGPLASPVVASAVIIDAKALKLKLDDSKKIKEPMRNLISATLRESYRYGIGVVSSEIIDEIGILNATFKAFDLAVAHLIANDNISDYQIIIDGNLKPRSMLQAETLVKGDSKCASIAAASIIAKVHRDSIMNDLSQLHPEYKWSKNKGYGTKEHIDALFENGITTHHRNSFLSFMRQKHLEFQSK